MDKIEMLISEKEIYERLDEIAKQIDKDYEGREIRLICILKGSLFVTCELAKRLKTPVTFDFLTASSYGNDIVTSGNVKIVNDLSEDIHGKDVIIIEDIIDTGITLDNLVNLLKQRNPNSLEICTLLSKPSRRLRDVNVKYIGFEIEDKFVVGYGLDYMQKYRNLPYIGVINN